ncbi:hypothetical protein D3C80_1923670 [compost metagenome]
MISRNDGNITGAHFTMYFRQLEVECFQSCRISGNIPPVAVEHIEINEIGENQIAVLRLIDCLERGFHQGFIAICLDHTADALMRINVTYLANRVHLAVSSNQPVE